MPDDEQMVTVVVNPGQVVDDGEKHRAGDELEVSEKEATRLEKKGAVSRKPENPEEPEEEPEPVEEPEEEPGPKNRPEDPEQANAEILDAMRQVVEEGKRLTKGDKPEVSAVEEILGYDISAKERDDLMEQLEAE